MNQEQSTRQKVARYALTAAQSRRNRLAALVAAKCGWDLWAEYQSAERSLREWEEDLKARSEESASCPVK